VADEKPQEKKWKELVRGVDLEPGKPAQFSVIRESIPIVFVPGIMGSRLKKKDGGEKVWDPDAKGFMLWNYGMAWVDAADKKDVVIGDVFDKDRLEPLLDDADHNADHFAAHAGAAERGWGGVSWGTYGEILEKMSAEDTWSPPVRAFFRLPVYACGYNWSASNADSGKKLKELVEKVVKENNGEVDGAKTFCDHVILVTHSMGGLVSRAAVELGAKGKVLGVIHGVQPVTGSPAAYWRMKAGFERKYGLPNPAAWVLGTNGAEVTALLGNMPGGLQLLPSPTYTVDGSDKKWLKLVDGKGGALGELPKSDAYEEIYKNENEQDYHRLIRKEYLLPEKKPKMSLDDAWKDCAKFIDKAKAFHDKYGNKQHAETQVFYGTGGGCSVDKAVYKLSPYGWKEMAGEAAQITLRAAGAFSRFGVPGLAAYLGYEALTHTEYWQSRGGFKTKILTKDGVTFEVELQPPAGSGDGTVPESSGKALQQSGDAPAKKEPRAFPGIDHEPAYHADQRSILEKARDAMGSLVGIEPEAKETTVDFTIAAIEALCRLEIKKAKK
jgi:hypothetical protein